MAIYEFSNYEEYLCEVIESHKQDRGYRTQLAKAIHVHPSYITRIVNGTTYITPDQAVALAEFWGLDLNQKEYFLWLVLKSRASDPAFKKMAEVKLKKIRQENDELGSLMIAEKVDLSRENEYYLNWIYSAVHMMVTVPSLNSVEKISKRLGLPENTIHSAIQNLKKMGLLTLSKQGALVATKNNVHLSNQSWMAPLQHKNWRISAIERIGRPGTDDIRYTGVHALSKKDLEKLRRVIRSFLLDVDSVVRKSPEETVCVLSFDLFEL